MPRIAIGCVVQDDCAGVERLIESCYQHVNYIFVIDGPYKFYDSVFPFSTDGLDYLVEKYHNVILEEAPDLLEHEKRSVYLDLCEEYNIDFLIIVDSDEYFSPQSDWQAFKKEIDRECRRGNIFNLKNYTSIEGMMIPVDQPRLWKDPSKLEYKNSRHYQFGLKDGNAPIVARKTLYSVKLMHDPHLRSDERKEKHDEYIKKLEEYENMKQLIETNKEKAQRQYVVWNS